MVFLEGKALLIMNIIKKAMLIVLSYAKEIEIIPEEKTLLISANSK